MRIMTLAQITDKWKRNAAGARQSYEDGINNPRFPWANSCSKAKDTYAEGVSRAISLDLYSKGVQSAGDEKWRSRSMNLGAARYSSGVNASVDAYRAGFEPYRLLLEGLALPPRYTRGDERNIERVSVIAAALHNKRMQLMGAT